MVFVCVSNNCADAVDWLLMHVHIVGVNHEKDTCFEKELVMGYADCKCFAGLVETSKVVSNVGLALCQTHCKQVPVFSRLSKSQLTHVASPQFLPLGQYGLCFG